MLDTDRQESAQGALDGLIVVDLSRVLAGPWCAQILGDLGAEVYKIEHPRQRDDTRTWGPPFLDDDTERPDAAYYLCCNRNKLSLTIDFSRPEGADVLHQLLRRADIVIENYKTGALSKYGLDYAAVQLLNPRVIYCSITGFGQTGPYANRGGYDFLIQGMSGLMSVTGNPDSEGGCGPMKVGIPVSDLATGLYSAISILAALNHRHRTGEGQYIDCALMDAQVSLLSNQAMNYLVGEKVPGRLGNAHPNVVPYRDFAASDRSILVACGNDRQFQALCSVLNRPDLAADPRFSTVRGRNQYRSELEAELAREIRLRPAAELLAAMEEAGVPAGPINLIDQALGDPQIQARDLVRTLYRRVGTAVPMIGYPAKFSKTPPSYRLAPPEFGEDTRDVLVNVLQLDDAAIERLASLGVINLAGKTL